MAGPGGVQYAPDFDRKKNIRLGMDDGQCQMCPNEDDLRLELHHRQYVMIEIGGTYYWRNDPVLDLRTVCIRCHDAITSSRRERQHQKKSIHAVCREQMIPGPIVKRRDDYGAQDIKCETYRSSTPNAAQRTIGGSA